MLHTPCSHADSCGRELYFQLSSRTFFLLLNQVTAKTIRAVYRWNLQERTVPKRKMFIDRGSAGSVIPVIMQMILSRGLWYVSRSTMMAFGCNTLIVRWNPAVPALQSTWLQPWLAHRHEWFCLSLGACKENLLSSKGLLETKVLLLQAVCAVALLGPSRSLHLAAHWWWRHHTHRDRWFWAWNACTGWHYAGQSCPPKISSQSLV